MVIINVLSSANVTTGGATCTGHLVTAVLLDEGLLTTVTVPYHGLGQSGLNIGSHACLPLFLHFITTQWDMIGLLTQSAKQVKVIMVNFFQTFFFQISVECHMSDFCTVFLSIILSRKTLNQILFKTRQYISQTL